jgi:hypothetical protein
LEGFASKLVIGDSYMTPVNVASIMKITTHLQLIYMTKHKGHHIWNWNVIIAHESNANNKSNRFWYPGASAPIKNYLPLAGIKKKKI